VRVLGHGLKYEPIMLRPSDAQWVEAQNLGILDVARIFGLPPEYLAAAVDGTAMTYSNLEMIDAQFLRTTLFPTYLRKIENALTTALPRGQRARFRTSDLLRPDAKTRAEIDAIYLPLGVYDRREVRAREGIAGPVPTMPATPAPNSEGVNR
jgi:HK97 family phage portal protein